MVLRVPIESAIEPTVTISDRRTVLVRAYSVGGEQVELELMPFTSARLGELLAQAATDAGLTRRPTKEPTR